MRVIRVMLVGAPRMLSDILRHALAHEAGVAIANESATMPADLAICARDQQVDVVVFPAGHPALTRARIVAVLHANPRLGLIEVDGPGNLGMLHHLISAHEDIGGLTQLNLINAVRAGAALRQP